MIVYLYFKDKKHCEKIDVFFFFKCKMFLKKRMGVLLLRRNASTNGRKIDLIERYILHRKPKHTIYVRYFSILLYLLNAQVAPTSA
jgi:hypothetical protein